MRPFITGMFLLVAMAMSAQDRTLLDRFCNNVATSCVELDYEYTVRVSGVNTAGKGTLSAQRNMWQLIGNGVEMYCDSEAVWVVDPSTKEAVIEPVAAEAATAFLTNPAVMFIRLDELFDVNGVQNTVDGNASLYVLRPKDKRDVSYFNVEILKDDASVRSGELAMSDGTLVKIKVSSMKLTPLRSVGDFRPKTSFDSTWIVTDLR